MPRRVDVPALIDGIRAGDRTALARGITLVESKLPAHRSSARQLLSAFTNADTNTVRLGITGVPGAGKSTFIDAFGCLLVEKGLKVAVLAVDPSSSRTGGSVLGDRTRMGALSQMDNAFIRPSPSGCHLGGVARATREAMVLCEGAGYDVVIIETVGVGQSEVAVSGMVDTFLMLHLSGAGDQLQGIKRGILEMVDVIAVNKADGENEGPARVTARELSIAMKLIRGEDGGRRTPVLTCSALHHLRLEDVWQAIQEHRAWLEETVGLVNYRADQQISWMWAQIESTLLDSCRATEELRRFAESLENQVALGETSALEASADFLTTYVKALPQLDWAQENSL